MSFAAGQKLRAIELNDFLMFDYMASDITVNNSTTFVETGLSVSLQASATYAFDGWLYYVSNPTADIKFQVTVSGGGSYKWTLFAPFSSTAPVVGAERQNYIDAGAGTFALSSAGDDTSTGSVFISCQPHGYATTVAAGTLSIQVAQGTLDVSDTILKTGSWLRLNRLDV